jgi:hypothetical protein
LLDGCFDKLVEVSHDVGDMDDEHFEAYSTGFPLVALG